MRFTGCILLLCWCMTATAQDDWVPPPPPAAKAPEAPESGSTNTGECGKQEATSEPVASYRISPRCEITDITPVGGYRYGIGQVKSEIRNFQSEKTVRRFIGGEYRYRRERSIELHKALERPATLVCEIDMMGSKVFSAHVIRTKILDRGRTMDYEEPVELENGELPDLGVYTHHKRITYTPDECR